MRKPNKGDLERINCHAEKIVRFTDSPIGKLVKCALALAKILGLL